MPSSGVTKSEGASSFDGEEPTEVIALPRAPQKTIEMRAPTAADEEGPDRTYLAPRSIPTQTVPDHNPEGDKIVINVKTPDPGEATEAAPDQPKLDAERARRRAPTVRIERGTLRAQGLLPGQPLDDAGVDVTFDVGTDAVEPPPDLTPRQEARRRERGDDWGGRDAATTVVNTPRGSPFKMVLVGVLLFVVLGGGAVFALGYLGVVTVPGIPRADDAPTTAPATARPTSTATVTATPPVTAAPAAPTQTAEVVSATSSAASPPSASVSPPKPVVKPRWVPPASTRLNPTTL